jgi:hypothetical protein
VPLPRLTEPSAAVDGAIAGCLAAGAAVLGETIFSASPVPESVSSLYATFAQITAGLLGFVIAGVSIVLLVVQDPKFARFRRTKHHKTLWKVFRSATLALAFATIFALAALFIDDSKPVLYIGIAIGVYSALRLLQVVRILFLSIEAVTKITDDIDEENERLEKEAAAARRA